MKRVPQTPRNNWPTILEQGGFDFHSIDPDGNDCAGTTDKFMYWREDVAYEFTETQIEAIHDATQEVHSMCIELVNRLASRGDLSRFGLTARATDLAYSSWLRGDFHLYGRFDIAMSGDTIKFLEYNADTPTSLIESSIAQWFWKEHVHQEADQFNSIHEDLVERLRVFFAKCNPTIYFGHADDAQEDVGNVRYLAEVAKEAGANAHLICLNDLGILNDQVVDLDDQRIAAMFKLYPWEWLANEQLGASAAVNTVTWLEPAWKHLLSNKAIWPLLWEMFPGHPNLLAASFNPADLTGPFIKKPFFSREGANVEMFDANHKKTLSVDGPYGAEGFIYQQQAVIPSFAAPEASSWHGPQEAVYAVLGAWVVGDKPAGLAVREDISPVTKNSAYFVPHFFR